ncbi:copper amine oxidase N-terminal domain-containing protein [Paenibacillus chibensis]|uniref:copper amine oxidase N-terminal domain-containing protein n=1 Tax=Paenibacillus chibensis TaxID=59846 RepID=UPI000FDC4549|nr:copper amine oxidase N-terminal domain-containing protein [Paenibacillus chibensis]MEC0370736.1 copper amine oxidase N-terminal domain-containing protein [Paenibacillus chibensis]
MKRNAFLKVGSALLACSVIFGAAVPAWADSAATADQLMFKVKTGSTSAIMNGNSETIVKPYSDHGTVMVPLGLFKRTFGSEVRLENANVVKVMYGAHTVSMTIGSRTAWVDGRKITLNAAPAMVAGTLMVPLRVVAEGIGASIAPESSGTLVVSLTPMDDAMDDEDVGIDADLGKTKIGNSFYGWTMNYPSGLILGGGEQDESIISFNDSEDKYYFEVHASNQDVKLGADELLAMLVEDSKDAGEIVVDRESFPQAKVPYARIIAKDGDGTFWESRMYYNNDRLYEIYFADLKATNYKDLKKYAGLLNSFNTSYNPSDKSVKDLSTVKNGMRSEYNDDYGISLNVPAGWSVDNSNMYYESKGGSYLSLNVSSSPKGSTLEQWSDELKTWLKESFVPDSYQIVGTSPIEVSGEQGLVNEVRYNYGDGWVTEFEVMLLHNGYRYYGEYAVPDTQKQDLSKFKDLMKSIDIDFKVVSDNFGNMEEDAFLISRGKTTTKVSKAFQYQINIPQYWTANQDKFEKSPVEYQFVGGRFRITADKSTSLDAAVNQLKSYYADAAKFQKNFKLEKTENITFAGEPAVSITLHQVKDGIPYSAQQILLQKNDIVYTISTSLNDANATDSQKAALDQTLKSFAWTPSK